MRIDNVKGVSLNHLAEPDSVASGIEGVKKSKFGAILLVAISIRVPGAGLLPLASILAIPLIAKSWQHCRNDSLVRKLLAAIWLAIIFGLALRVFRPGPVGIDTSAAALVQSIVWISSLLYLSIVSAYSLSLVGLRLSLPIIGIGSAVGMYLYVLPPTNIWKYAIGYGVTIFVLSVASNFGRFATSVAAIGLMVFSLVQGSRSLAIIVACALVVMLLTTSRTRMRGLRSKVGGLLLVVGSFALIAIAFGWSMQAGLFGERLRRSYDEQTAGGQLIIFGGRTEWRAALSLFEDRPLGFGVGAFPTSVERIDAVASATEYRGSFHDPYYLKNVFGARVDMHSGFWNLWFHFGVVGMVVAILMLILMVRGIVDALISSSSFTCPIVVVLGMGIWDILFSPMAQYDHISLAMGVAIWLHITARSEPLLKNDLNLNSFSRTARVSADRLGVL